MKKIVPFPKTIEKGKWILLLFFILIVAVGSVYYFRRSQIKCDKSDMDNGWSCTSNLEFFSQLKQYQSKCLHENGEFESGSIQPGPAGSYFTCAIPYSDAGKVCKKSTECQGKCEYPKRQSDISSNCVLNGSKDTASTYVCSQEISGVCSKTQLSLTEFCGSDWLEVSDNTILIHRGMMCEY